MTRKIIGTILLVASGALAFILFANGMFIFPHIIGPATLAGIGIILLAFKRKMDKSVE